MIVKGENTIIAKMKEEVEIGREKEEIEITITIKIMGREI